MGDNEAVPCRSPQVSQGACGERAMTRDRRYKEIQLAQLRSFCLAATEGNFTSAARVLGLSASTVWHQVRALERELKAKLLRRRGRAVEVTDEGRLLLGLVQPHVTGLDSLARLFEARRVAGPQELVVASGAYLLAHHLPAAVGQFRAERPLVQVTLRVGSWSALHRLAEREQVDVAILACDPDVPRSPYLEYEHLFDEPFSLLAPADHPLARARRVSPEELVRYPLILPPAGGADRKALDRLLRQHNLSDRVRPALVCGLIDVAKSYVLAGVGVALLYVTGEVARTTPGLRVRPLEAEVGRLPIAMAVRKGAHLPEWVRDFQRIVRHFLSGPATAADR
jgi:DNA-binding transcriptional LysR family regulator